MIDFRFEDAKGKMVFLKLNEDGDESTEYVEVNTMDDYYNLERIIYAYQEQGILSEYFIYYN
jgi:hypothetical protein